MKLGNGRWESAKFNNRLQVTELALGTSDGDGSLWKLAYEYGEFENGAVNQNKNTGNIAKQTLSFSGLASPLIQTYKYDSLYRITEAKETVNASQNWIQTYNYDRFGNRIGFGQTGNGLAPTQPTINPQTNRFVTGQGIRYDANGNIDQDVAANGAIREFVFNGENKQTEIKANGVLLSKYFYDGEGKRVKKQIWTSGVITEETVFVYSSGKLVAEYSTAPPVSNPTTSYTATDQLGSPRVITNALGQVTSRRDFMPFGEELQAENNYRKSADFKYGQIDSVRQRFTGYQKDSETGLDFAEARMYENRHGRFTAVDPLLASGKSANPQSFNRYVYTMNRPLKFTDKTGLQTAELVDDVVAVINVIAYRFTTRNYCYNGNCVQTQERLAPAIRYYDYTQGGDANFSTNRMPAGGLDDYINHRTAPTVEAINRKMAKVEQGIQYVPVLSSMYNAQKAGLELDRGKGSYTNFAVQTGIMGVDIATLPMGGGTTKKAASSSIALGLETLQETGGTRFVLKELSETTGGIMSKYWASEGITRRTVNNRFGRAFHQAVERADSIHFALDGLIDDLPGAIDRGRRIGFNVERRNVTNAELYTVFSRDNLLNKTQFYLNNQPIPTPRIPFRFGQ